MRLSFIRSYISIKNQVTTQEVADFMILSGVNGSGKTNLLEAIQNGSIGVDGVSNPPEQQVRLFKITELLRTAESQQSVMAYQDNWANVQNRVQDLKREFTSHPRSLQAGSSDLKDAVRNALVAEKLLTLEYIQNVEVAVGKPIADFTQVEFRQNMPLIIGQHDPFAVSITEIFLAYHGRNVLNLQARFAVDQEALGSEDLEPLTDDQFISKYGRPPWEMLNDTLAIVGLDHYKFSAPQGLERTVNYEPILTDDRDGSQIRVHELSSGERTLLTVALTLYTGSEFEDSIELPKVLLLDEADASLHPSMIRSLITVVKEIFHDKYGVRVILTTHSPTTVALAPEEALYIMHREGAERLTKASSRDEALSALIVGLPTLSVKIEDRRQIFVESDIDAYCHDKIYTLVKPMITGTRSLTFIESGRGGSGSAGSVKSLVQKLQSGGNNTVKGLIDRDNRSSAPENIHYSNERYSLENFILDPLALGLLLIREKYVSPEAMGLPAGFKYFEVGESAQTIVDYVLNTVSTESDNADRTSVTYSNGSEVSVQKWYFETVGHVLEDRLKASFNHLNRYRDSDDLKKEVINKIYEDLPDIVPRSLVDLYQELAT